MDIFNIVWEMIQEMKSVNDMVILSKRLMFRTYMFIQRLFGAQYGGVSGDKEWYFFKADDTSIPERMYAHNMTYSKEEIEEFFHCVHKYCSDWI